MDERRDGPRWLCDDDDDDVKKFERATKVPGKGRPRMERGVSEHFICSTDNPTCVYKRCRTRITTESEGKNRLKR